MMRADQEIDFFKDRRPLYNRETDKALAYARNTFSYDPETGSLVWIKPHPMRVAFTGKVAGSINSNGYRQVRFMQGTFMCHRIAWAIHYNRWPAGLLDHINGDKSDNRIVNLREATGSLNAFNKDVCKGGINRGVVKRGDLYATRIQRNGRTIWLGTFQTEAEAIAAYRGAAVALYGNQNVRAMAAKETDR